MVWGQIIPLFLLILLYGVCCNGMFNPERITDKTYQCGEDATVTYTLPRPLKNVSIQQQNTSSILSSDSPHTEKEGKIRNEKLSIEWAEDKVIVTIFKVMFSDTLKYTLFLQANESKGHSQRVININVSGICEPEIFENNETKELECKAESEINASIDWFHSHSSFYQKTETKQLDTGFSVKSFLKLTEIGDNNNATCCNVSYWKNDEYTEKISCIHITSVEKISGTKSAASTVTPLLVVALIVAVGLLYVWKRNRVITRGRSLSTRPIIDQDEEVNVSGSSLLQPGPV